MEDNFAVLKINMDISAMIAAAIAWALVYHSNPEIKKQPPGFGKKLLSPNSLL